MRRRVLGVGAAVTVDVDRWSAVRLEGERLAESEGVDLDYWIDLSKNTGGAVEWIAECYPKQHAAIFGPERYALIEGSTKCGKTEGVLKWQYLRCIGDPIGMEHWWVSYRQYQADIAFNRARRRLVGKVVSNLTRRTLTFDNGAVWRFRTAEDPQALYGDEVADAVFDEASRCQDESIYAVRTTLSTTRGPMRLIGNVNGRNNRHFKWCREIEAGEHDNATYTMLTAMDAVDAGVLDPDEVEDAKRNLPEDRFNQDYLCIPMDDGGNPFGLEVVRAAVQRVLTLAPAEAWGLDLAKKRDWLVLKGLARDGTWCQRHRWQRKAWGDSIDLIAEIYAAHSAPNAPIYVDATGLGDVVCDLLAAEMLPITPIVFTAPSRQALRAGLEVQIRAGHARVWHESLGEYESLEYAIRGGTVAYVVPDALHDDEIDADSLAWAAGRTVWVGSVRPEYRQQEPRTRSRGGGRIGSRLGSGVGRRGR